MDPAFTIIIAMGCPVCDHGILFLDDGKENRKAAEGTGQKDEARKQNEIIVLKGVNAAIALGEATARAVQRIPDAHCNGDMHQALEYAEKIKHEQKDFFDRTGR